MGISAKIINDSINSATNDRLTTFLIVFPRFILPEFATHRMLSKNSASTRAIPTAKIIQAIQDNPAMPVFWGKNQAGMQAAEELQDLTEDAGYFSWGELQDFGPEDGASHSCEYQAHSSGKLTSAKKLWLSGRNSMIVLAKRLVNLGLHKQIAGRILEPWFNITVLVSGTEWENFFALRAHKDAQPEIRALAEAMLEEYNKSIPEIKEPVDKVLACLELAKAGKIQYPIDALLVDQTSWHVPYETRMPTWLSLFDKLRVAIARCARLSYLTFDGEMNVEKDFAIYDKLLNSNPKHASPAEHVAFPISESKFVGNYRGWVQFRKLLPEETQTDSRVIKRKVVNGVVQ